MTACLERGRINITVNTARQIAHVLVQFIYVARSELFRCVVVVLLSLLASGFIPVQAQDPVLKGLGAVRVLVSWAGGADADKDALKTDVELKLRQAGLLVLSEDGSTLFVGIDAGSAAGLPVIVELREKAYTARDMNSQMKFTAFEAYLQWRAERGKEPNPITDAEDKEHQAAVFAEAKENGNLPLSQVLTVPRDVSTWQKYGVAQNARTESVQEIIDRYQRIPQFQTPAGRAYLAPLLDHEVQAAIANAQHPSSPGTVRDTIESYVDAFLNDWLAASPKQR